MKKLLVVLFILTSISIVKPQELDPTVVINNEQLSTYSKERLQNFATVVEDYLARNRFTSAEWKAPPIKCSFNIFFTGGGENNVYNAQVVIASQRPVYNSEKSSLMMNISDASWQFIYEDRQSMNFNPGVFDPLLSFLDYYAYLIIGFHLDSMGEEPYGGTPVFRRAEEIAVLGASSAFSDGWELNSKSYNKRVLLNNLFDAKFNQFRQDYYDYHWKGLDYYFKYPNITHKNIAKLVNNLWDIKDQIDSRNVLMKVFFDAKNGEITDYLKDYENKDVLLEKLQKVDPPHIRKYEEAKS